jgi:hypothetical protein
MNSSRRQEFLLQILPATNCGQGDLALKLLSPWATAVSTVNGGCFVAPGTLGGLEDERYGKEVGVRVRINETVGNNGAA